MFYLTFYKLVICIIDFSTDKLLYLISGSKSFLPFRNSLLFYVLHNFEIAIWNFAQSYRHIIENSIMQMINL